MLKIIEGSVNNAFDAHGQVRNPRLARSIAKRATGTLSSQWGDVLALASSVSESGVVTIANSHADLGPLRVKAVTRRGASHLRRRSPLVKLWKSIAMQVGSLRRSGQTERADAYVEVLKMVASLLREGSNG